jgi:hypothetical protein
MQEAWQETPAAIAAPVDREWSEVVGAGFEARLEPPKRHPGPTTVFTSTWRSFGTYFPTGFPRFVVLLAFAVTFAREGDHPGRT